MNIHIVGGNGAMGTWLKNFFESQNISVTISGRAQKNIADLQKSDIVFFSVPISQTPAVLNELSQYVPTESLIVDLSSSKTEVIKTLAQLSQPTLAIHMLFGPTVSTIQNQKIVFMESKIHEKIMWLKNIFTSAGARVIEMKVEEHENQMAYIQGLIHFVNIALAKTLSDKGIDLTTLSTPVTLAQASAITRVLAQNPHLLTEIQITNPRVPFAIQEFLEITRNLSRDVEEKNTNQIEKQISALNHIFTPHKEEKAHSEGKIQTFKLPQKSVRIGYLGPEGTYSFSAAKSLITPDLHSLTPLPSIYMIFEAVAHGVLEYGVVPAENSTEGTVRETLDFLVDFDVISNGVVELPIHHYLLSYGQNLTDIKTVISHPQALAQCRNWLVKHLPHAQQEQAMSTVSEISRYSNDPTVAFISPVYASEKYGLTVLGHDIGDNPHNITKFYVISQKKNSLESSSGKTLLFVTVFNRVGVLRDILDIIANYNINLTNIESRPSHEKVWDYYFFIELNIAPGDPKLQELLNILKQHCPVIKVLGSV